MQFFQQTVDQSFLALLGRSEWIGFESVEVGLSCAGDHDLRVALVVTDRHDILKGHKLERSHIAHRFVLHIWHLLLLFARVFPHLHLVPYRDSKTTRV